MSAVLKIEKANVTYGELRAVRDVSLEVGKGELVLLLGANGAGKSSLLNAVVGLQKLADGSVTLFDQQIDSAAPPQRIKQGIGYLPEGRGVFPSLTVEENIVAGLTNRASRAAAKERSFAMFPRLGERRKQVSGSLSGGEQQMVSLSRALASDPTMLILDEPSLGLAPAIVDSLFASIAALRDAGIAILLVEQFAHAALRIADRAGLMVRGVLGEIRPASEFLALTPAELGKKYFELPEVAAS